MPIVSIVTEDDELGNQISYPFYFPNKWPQGTTFVIPPIIRSLKLADTDVVRMIAAESTNITNGSPRSIKLLTDDADYTVTTGKTAKLVLLLRSEVVDTKFNVREDDTADAGTGTIKYAYTTTLDFDATTLITVCPDWDATPKTFAAGKFITLESTVAAKVFSVLGGCVIES